MVLINVDKLFINHEIKFLCRLSGIFLVSFLQVIDNSCPSYLFCTNHSLQDTSFLPYVSHTCTLETKLTYKLVLNFWSYIFLSIVLYIFQYCLCIFLSIVYVYFSVLFFVYFSVMFMYISQYCFFLYISQYCLYHSASLFVWSLSESFRELLTCIKTLLLLFYKIRNVAQS